MSLGVIGGRHMPYPHNDSSLGDHPPPSLVRAELDRILASELFTRSERLSAFLKFIVDQTLAGQGDSLKEQVIAVELYGKGADFNTAADPIVRVDARRLRDRLREYYATAPDRGVVISVPKGSYTAVFHGNAADVATAPSLTARNTGAIHDDNTVVPPAGPATSAGASTADRGSRRWWIAGVTIVLIAAVSWGVMRLRTDHGSEPTRLLTVTSMPGAEEDPALSPDGNFVAFSWAASPTEKANIWIKAVDGDELRQLTNTPDNEKFPAWSPDSQYIAFTRLVNGWPSVFRVSALGGPERLIAAGAMYSSWLPDGRAIVMSSGSSNERFILVRQTLEDGARQQLTEAPGGFLDHHPRVSPDGKTVAFMRQGGGRTGLFVVPMSGGEPTILGEWRSGVASGLAWTPDGQEILFARPEISGRRLVRVRIGGQGPALPVSNIPYGSLGPSVSRFRGQTYRLAINSGQPDVGLRLVDLQARQGTRITADSPFCDATRMDTPGRFSPDGSQVAFTSDRSGSQQVWVANRDGSSLRSVTQLKDATVSLGSWSPDSRSLTFDATIGESTHIYVVPLNGGPVKKLTDGKATEIDPEWSRDGRSIYYSSTESGGWAIWRMAADGSARVRLTSEAGFEARQSPDERSIYFIDRPRFLYGLGPVATLKRVSIEGGPADVVDAPVIPGAWELTDAGIVFVAARAGPMDTSSSPSVLVMYDFTERRVRTLGELAFRIGPVGANHFLTVSRDGRWALASHVDGWERDILVIDNFR